MLSVVLHPAQTPTTALPLLIVHGLFGSARNWGVIARRLSDTRDVIAVDMRNHGASPWYPTQGYPEMAGDLAEVIGAHVGRADVLGHSMGGKAAMMLALTRPDCVDRLVVADIAPTAYLHDNTGHVRAMRALKPEGLTSRTEADAGLAATVPDASLRAFFLQSLDLKADPPRWRLNLDVLAADMPKIVGWPEVSGQFAGRCLFISGAESEYVRPEDRGAILALFPAARFVKIPGAGHWLHADKPREFEETVRVFLSQVPTPGG
jgi:pimeloyl-ACP methyl ester carboxylesterase